MTVLYIYIGLKNITYCGPYRIVKSSVSISFLAGYGYSKFRLIFSLFNKIFITKRSYLYATIKLY